MDLTKPQTIEEGILSLLSDKAYTGQELLTNTQKIKPGFTKQALYQLLHKLTEREIVVKHGKQFSLSQVWIQKMNDFFSIAAKQYGTNEQGADFLSLSDGDKVTYTFKNPTEADRFWGHAFNILSKLLQQKEPLYIYNPHEWFLFARKESEVFLFEELRKKRQQVWLICGDTTPLDMYAKKFFDGSILQYHMTKQKFFEKRNYYLNIFGDYSIEGRIDEETAKKVDYLYTNANSWSIEIEDKLKNLVDQGKTTITISRNKHKVEKLKRLFTPYFYKV